MKLLILGEDFPGPVPETGDNTGGLFEIDASGTMHLIIQMPNPDAAEVAAIQEGFSSYSIYVSLEPPYVAVLVWKYPAPMGYVETPFHAGAYDDNRLQEFQKQSPEDNNALTVIGLDRKKIIHLRMSGLMFPFMASLHEVIAVQQQHPVTTEQYQAALERVYRLTSKEIYQRGVQFRHRQQNKRNMQ